MIAVFLCCLMMVAMVWWFAYGERTLMKYFERKEEKTNENSAQTHEDWRIAD